MNVLLPRVAAALLAANLLAPAGSFAQPAPAPAAPLQSAPHAAPATPAAPAAPSAPSAPSAVAPAAPATAPAAPVAATPATPADTVAQPPAIAAPQTTAPPVELKLPRDLSPWGMFMAADIVVKAVMVGLAFASVLTWTIWFAKAMELMAARARMRRALDALNKARSWQDATQAVTAGTARTLIDAADTELRLSADAILADGVKERIGSRLERLEAAAARRMIRGTGLLATIGATAPFVGLFGTVWGIMNSFIGISKSHTTNLAVVAPGIAEALLATALGLIAAIPAVVMYNMFSRWTASYRAETADATAALLRIVSRDLDRGAFQRGRRTMAAE